MTRMVRCCGFRGGMTMLLWMTMLGCATVEAMRSSTMIRNPRMKAPWLSSSSSSSSSPVASRFRRRSSSTRLASSRWPVPPSHENNHSNNNNNAWNNSSAAATTTTTTTTVRSRSSSSSSSSAASWTSLWGPPLPRLHHNTTTTSTTSSSSSRPSFWLAPPAPPPPLWWNAAGATTAAVRSSRMITSPQHHPWRKPLQWLLAAAPSSTIATHEQTTAAAASSTTTTSTTTTSSSLPDAAMHLQRTDATNPHNNNFNNNNNNNSPPPPPQNVTKLKVHAYVDPRDGTSWKALNTAKSKFVSFLRYNRVVAETEEPWIVTREYRFHEKTRHQQEGLRTEWRTLWKNRRLLTDRTEFLALYPSDQTKTNNTEDEKPKIRRRGGFADLLHLYSERLIAILKDEIEDSQRPTSLVQWLQDRYGREQIAALYKSRLQQEPVSVQLAKLKHFLEWFRTYFPYYYDRCGTCGASIKEEPAEELRQINNMDGDDDEEEEDGGYQTFVGYVYPDELELKGKATRTELYQCHKCNAFTRFPRFNSAWHVMDHQRGRCGEYSMLLYRFLRALDHDARWVVDWADHVWAEVYLDGRWIHLDPCEAAVDENLIYQGWGKKQTYIIAFHAPQTNGWKRHYRFGLPSSSSTNSFLKHAEPKLSPTISDVTNTYTSDSWDVIHSRRDENSTEVQTTLSTTIQKLEERVQDLWKGTTK